MDQMVSNVQSWLNTTYGNNPNYTTIPEDGVTGGTTVAALITALQIEIGISPADGVFGPATMAACPTLPKTGAPKNEVFILQGALYCKGYNPNGLDGGYGNGVITAIKQFQSDAGLSTQDGITTPMIFKALLNTDAFVLISGGDSNIRTIQKNLNRDYNSIIGLIPTDGVYGKSTNVALIKALQHEEGQSVDGLWGSKTMAACPTIPGNSSTKNFILLLQYSLYCNGYNPNGFDGLYGNGVKTAVTNFQTFVGLNADGYAGPQVWASLLVSYGDQSRKGTACDCSTTITPEKAATLVANGYKLVGRYLTGSYAMTSNELDIIFGNNLRVIPIFEVGGNKLSYFTSLQGLTDGESAIIAAKELNLPDNTIIYFCVDFDALYEDVTNSILPYFSSVKSKFSELMSGYKIGIYAPRNVCSRVAAAGYSCSSFVCDMSSGFSGNLGYKIPTDWAFDQISTITIGSGSGLIEIDNDISSGKDSGVSNYRIEDVTSLIKSLDTAANNYLISEPISVNNIASRNTLVLNFLRSYRYNGVNWFLTLGPTDTGFTDYLSVNESSLLNEIMPHIKLNDTLVSYFNNAKTDLPHLSASTLGYSNEFLVPDFWAGWGGDLATAIADVTGLTTLSENQGKTVDELAESVVGTFGYSCPRMDIENDIDAIYIANNIDEDMLGNMLDTYFSSVNGSVRRNILFGNLGFTSSPTENQLNSTLYDMMTGSSGFTRPVEGSKFKSLATYKDKVTNQSYPPTDEVVKATTLAFASYILNIL